MTKLLDDALTAVRRLPEETQDDVGRFLLDLAENTSLNADEAVAISEAEAEIASGRGIGGDELRMFWQSLGS